MEISNQLGKEIKDVFTNEWEQYKSNNHYNNRKYGYTEEDIQEALESFAENWLDNLHHEDYLDAIIEDADSVNNVEYITNYLDFEKYQKAETIMKDYINKIVNMIATDIKSDYIAFTTEKLDNYRAQIKQLNSKIRRMKSISKAKSEDTELKNQIVQLSRELNQTKIDMNNYINSEEYKAAKANFYSKEKVTEVKENNENPKQEVIDAVNNVKKESLDSGIYSEEEFILQCYDEYRDIVNQVNISKEDRESIKSYAKQVYKTLNESKQLREAEEDNTSIEGQMGFEEYSDNLENGEYIYETEFHLESPVNDIKAAQEYLSKNRMVQYLWGDERYNIGKDLVTSVDWILEDEESGVIRVRAKRELAEQESENISEWISGQNSDGLGEGFEQQDFAESYFNPVTGNGPYSRREMEREIEKLYENIDISDLISDGYLDEEIWEAVEVFKNENNANSIEDLDVEDLDDDDVIYDIIVADPITYLDNNDIIKAKDEYIAEDVEFNENNWYNMASFDWQDNDYVLYRVQK